MLFLFNYNKTTKILDTYIFKYVKKEKKHKKKKFISKKKKHTFVANIQLYKKIYFFFKK